MKHYFKVKFGFGALDKVSVTGSELEKAIYAQLKGTPVRIGNSFVNGRNIISITPDYHRYTGWNETYEPTEPEDWKQIKRDCPDFNGVLEAYTDRVRTLIYSGKDKEVGTLPQIEIDKVKKIDRVGTTKSIGEIKPSFMV